MTERLPELYGIRWVGPDTLCVHGGEDAVEGDHVGSRGDDLLDARRIRRVAKPLVVRRHALMETGRGPK